MNVIRTSIGALALATALWAQGAELVSVSAAGGAAGDQFSSVPSEELRPFSTDGRFLAFSSGATDLVAGDANGATDVFVRDRSAGTTELVSVAVGGGSGNGASFSASLSSSGRYVLFSSGADDLVAVDSNGNSDVFLRDRQTGTTILVSRNQAGTNGGDDDSSPLAMTPDGRYALFSSDATDLVASDGNGDGDVFVFDRVSGTTELVSVATGGGSGNGASSANRRGALSDDGRYVVFASAASDLVATDTNGFTDVLLRDRAAGTTTLISAVGGDSANGASFDGVIAADGSRVVFNTDATDLLAVADTNGGADLFAWTRASGAFALVTINAAGTATVNGSNRGDPRLSANGRYVAFECSADDVVALPDANGTTDVFRRDLVAGVTILVSRDIAGTGTGNGQSEDAQISDDGRFVYFESAATDIGPLPDLNGQKDTFAFDVASETMHVVSGNTAGDATGNDFSYDPVVSPNGVWVAFDSGATDLDPTVTDGNDATDVYVARFAPAAEGAGGGGGGGCGTATPLAVGVLLLLRPVYRRRRRPEKTTRGLGIGR